jgi:hypothetical protein
MIRGPMGGRARTAVEVHAELREEAGGRWVARTRGERAVTVSGPTRERCLATLRRTVARTLPAGGSLTLVAEVLPRLAGVAEAAEVLGWDKRRVITYLDRGRFPPPYQSLAAGRVWLRADVERFASEWRARYRPRRPRGGGNGGGG